MHSKAVETFRILLLIGIFLAVGWCFFLLQNPPAQNSVFELQQEYAEQIQNQVQNLLEPIVGPGNIRTAAQVRLQQIDQTVIVKENIARKKSITTTRYQGPALKTQHISLVLNSTNKTLENDVWALVENALGINFRQGDTLSIRIIPFAQVPFWSFGLARVTLIRLAGGLALLAILFISVLICIYRKQNQPRQIPVHPNEALWQQASKLSPMHLSNTLNMMPPEISAFILYRFPNKLSEQITNLMPDAYVAQVMIHMGHLQNLTALAYKNLLVQSEQLLKRLTQKNTFANGGEKAAEILAKSRQKKSVLNEIHKRDQQSAQNMYLNHLTLDSLTDWSDNDFQTLLRHLDKKTAILALQTAPLKLHQCFAKNLPVDVWTEISDRCRQTPGTYSESQQAQQKVLDIAKNLIINHLVKN